MFSKVLSFTVLLTVVVAEDFQHGLGFAYSSQHISRHDGPSEIVHIHGGHGEEQGYGGEFGAKQGDNIGYGNEGVLGHGYGHIDYHAHPKYAFQYQVEDPHTGDRKFQHEIRDGDVVKGVYSLHQPDGSERTMHYYGDHHSGFHADVKYGTHHIVPEYQHHH